MPPVRTGIGGNRLTRIKSILLLSLLAATAPPPAWAHFPPEPDLDCQIEEFRHDFIGAFTVSLTVLQDEHDLGEMLLLDGSINCPLEPFCPTEVGDLDGDTIDDSVPCPPGPELLIPGTDNEFEFGLGGVFLPASHHDEVFSMRPDSPRMAFAVGSDGDGDGVVNGGDEDDCLEPYQVITGHQSYTTECDPGLDDGWLVFVPCFIDTHDNGSIVDGPDGPLLLDTDGDGFPDTVNTAWDLPTITPPTTAAPDNGCATYGHIG